MAKQESYFGPFPPKPEPEEYGTPCPNCGGPRLARDADRWCESCRKGIGCYAEFVCGWYPELDPAKDTSAAWRESQRRKLPDFYEFSELAREAVGDAEFTEATFKKLEALLLRPKTDGGMFDQSADIDISPREWLLRTRRSEIMAFLRKRQKGDGEPQANNPPQRRGRSKAEAAAPKNSDKYAVLVAALTKHHKYADGGCLSLEPIEARGLADAANVSPATASRFFHDKFHGHANYKTACRSGRIADCLKLLNGDISPEILIGRGDGQRERE